jgi:hypothetical protein
MAKRQAADAARQPPARSPGRRPPVACTAEDPEQADDGEADCDREVDRDDVRSDAQREASGQCESGDRDGESGLLDGSGDDPADPGEITGAE